jgi:nucleotide-binding universal stress UspA family protein
MFKHILVPVDFSPASELAVEHAAAVGGELDLLHVWEPPALTGPHEIYIGMSVSAAMLDAIQKQSRAGLEQLAQSARKKGALIRTVTSLPGTPYEVIVEEAKRGKYDLVVVGTHSKKGMARMFIGSVAERVVRYAPCPVLVARSVAHAATAATSPA